MDKNDLHDAAFGQWLKSRHLQKKHVFAGEEKRATDYSKHYNSVENTNQLNFDITQVNTVYNAQVGGYKQERDTIYYNSPTTFTHNSSLTLQALPIKDTWENLKFLAMDKEDHPGFYCHAEIEMIGLHESDRGWYDNHRCHYKAIGISRLWKTELKDYEKDLLHLYICIEVPEYAIRLNNMTLDEKIKASIVMEKFSRVGNSFEDAEEKDIFQMWLFNNRTPYENKYKHFADTIYKTYEVKIDS